VNYPNNPTGARVERAFYEEAVAFAQRHHVLLVSDLAYSELTYDGTPAPSALECDPDHEVTVEFHSCSKTFGMAGLRVGFAVGNRAAIDALAAYRTNIGYGTPTGVQHAAAYALNNRDTLVPATVQEYRRRRDAMATAFAAAGWHITIPTAAMYLWLPVPEGVDDWTWVKTLIDEDGVVVYTRCCLRSRREWILPHLVSPRRRHARTRRRRHRRAPRPHDGESLTMSDPLQSVRERLDDLDKRVVQELAERQRLVEEVAALKADPTLPLHDVTRERDLLSRVAKLAEAEGVDGYFVQSLYRRILEHSVRFQAARQGESESDAPLLIAYQGVEASYSHAAARAHFAPSPREVRYHGYTSFGAALDAVLRDEAEFAFLPIENSVVGSITETYDLLSRTDVHLVGEEILRVEHCLLALEQVPLGLIRRIGSHPQALAQCSTFLENLDDCRVEFEEDTARAAMLVAESGDLSRGAIASEEAATRYGLQVLKRSVANQKEVYTRFVVIGRKPKNSRRAFAAQDFAPAHHRACGGRARAWSRHAREAQAEPDQTGIASESGTSVAIFVLSRL